MEDEKKNEILNVVEKVETSNEAIQVIIEKAILDPEFKAKLIESPDEILDQYEISEIARIMIKSLTKEDFDKLTSENISEYFAADSAIYTPDFDENIQIEYSDDDDI